MKTSRVRLLVILCIAALLFSALTLTAAPLLLVLVPLWFFFAAVVVFEIRSIEELCDSLQSPILVIVSPRPPPVR
jgi:hypothetical protein